MSPPLPTGVLLAAGRGSRFGSDKRWQPLADGTPMALASAQALRKALPQVVAVVGAGEEALAVRLAACGCRPVLCADAALGMGHSLAAGVAAAADAAGWLVALADMPWIRPATHRRVAEALRRRASAVRAVCEGRPGHPVAFPPDWFEDLLALSGDAGARRLLAARPPLACPVDDPGVLRDVDRPADLGAADAARAGLAT